MTEKELRKLAEWVGFKELPNGEIWYERDDLHFPHEYKVDNYPDFTSLDVCFKWLVPEAKTKFGITRIDFCYIADEIGCRVFGGYGAMLELGKSNLVKTEALALCEAIEKLID